MPRPASVSRSVTGALAAELFVCIGPAAKLAWRTVRSLNAAGSPSESGGSLVSCRIAAQSCRAQAVR